MKSEAKPPSHDLSQDIWNACDEIGQHLENLSGIEWSLLTMLDDGLKGVDQRTARGIYALVTASRLFRQGIAQEAETLRETLRR